LIAGNQRVWRSGRDRCISVTPQISLSHKVLTEQSGSKMWLILIILSNMKRFLMDNIYAVIQAN